MADRDAARDVSLTLRDASELDDVDTWLTRPPSPPRRLRRLHLPRRSLAAIGRRLPSRAAPRVALGLGLAVWGLFAGYDIWRCVYGPILDWQDTVTYEAAARFPILSIGFLAGQRPPVIPLLWKLTGTNMSFALTQTVISVLSWSLLAGTVAFVLRSPWRALLGGTVVLVFASTWQVTEWDWSMLTESISLSALAVMFTSAFWLARRITLPRGLVFVGACLVYEGARDQGIWVIGTLGLIVAGLSLFWLVRHRASQALRAGLLALALLAISATAEVAAESSHRNVINVYNVFEVRVFPFPSRVAWFAAHGMPEAKAIDALAASAPRPAPGTRTVIYPDLDSKPWLPLGRWFENDSQLVYAEYLITHPVYVFTAPFAKPELTFNDAGGSLAFYAGPGPLLGVVPTLMFPPGDVVVFLGLFAGALLLFRRMTRVVEVRMLVGLLVVGLVAVLFAWHGDGEEVARHTIEGNVEARLAVMLLLVFGVLWRRGAKAAEAIELPVSESHPVLSPCVPPEPSDTQSGAGHYVAGASDDREGVVTAPAREVEHAGVEAHRHADGRPEGD